MKDDLSIFLAEQLARTVPYDKDPEIADRKRDLMLKLCSDGITVEVLEKMQSNHMVAMNNTIMEGCRRSMDPGLKHELWIKTARCSMELQLKFMDLLERQSGNSFRRTNRTPMQFMAPARPYPMSIPQPRPSVSGSKKRDAAWLRHLPEKILP